MKKIILFLICLFIEINVSADKKIDVLFSKCVDGDTAYFIMNEKEVKVRFLAIDTPESVSTNIDEEPYGKEASDFTCKIISNSNKIQLEFDNNSDKLDKYNRYLVWIWVDDYLLQDEIIKKGYGKVAYLYGDYKYTSILKENEKIAKINKLNIWSDKNNVNYIYYIIILSIIVIACIISKKYRNKVIKKIKRAIK